MVTLSALYREAVDYVSQLHPILAANDLDSKVEACYHVYTYLKEKEGSYDKNSVLEHMSYAFYDAGLSGCDYRYMAKETASGLSKKYKISIQDIVSTFGLTSQDLLEMVVAERDEARIGKCTYCENIEWCSADTETCGK